MKCPKCDTKKPMGLTQARVTDGVIVPTWLCSPCGANFLVDSYIFTVGNNILKEEKDNV